MKFLVTGGAGFIGHHLITRLVNDGHEIVSIDDYSTGFEKNHIEGAKYIRGHTSNIFQLLNEESNFDLVFHLGEHPRIVPSFEQIQEYWHSNSLGTFYVIEYCREHNLKIIYAGSSTKFAKEGIGHSPYSFTKAKSAELIHYYSEWFGLKYNICYFYNVFGFHNALRGDEFENVIDIFNQQYLRGEEITVCGTGQQRRSFTFVDDIVSGLVLTVDYPLNEEFQLNNLKEFTILEIARMFSDNIKFLPARPGDRSCSATIDNKARELLGWDTTMNIDEWIKYIKIGGKWY